MLWSRKEARRILTALTAFGAAGLASACDSITEPVQREVELTGTAIIEDDLMTDVALGREHFPTEKVTIE